MRRVVWRGWWGQKKSRYAVMGGGVVGSTRSVAEVGSCMWVPMWGDLAGIGHLVKKQRRGWSLVQNQHPSMAFPPFHGHIFRFNRLSWGLHAPINSIRGSGEQQVSLGAHKRRQWVVGGVEFNTNFGQCSRWWGIGSLIISSLLLILGF